MKEKKEFNELMDTIVGHLEMCRLLEQQGIKSTEKNLDKHFPYRNVGCKGLVCPNCGSKRLWIVKRDWRAYCSKIDVDVYLCITCGDESSFYYDCCGGCYYNNPDEVEDRMREEAICCQEDAMQDALMDSQADDLQC